jgi:hypothetical protein
LGGERVHQRRERAHQHFLKGRLSMRLTMAAAEPSLRGKFITHATCKLVLAD